MKYLKKAKEFIDHQIEELLYEAENQDLYENACREYEKLLIKNIDLKKTAKILFENNFDKYNEIESRVYLQCFFEPIFKNYTRIDHQTKLKLDAYLNSSLEKDMWISVRELQRLIYKKKEFSFIKEFQIFEVISKLASTLQLDEYKDSPIFSRKIKLGSHLKRFPTPKISKEREQEELGVRRDSYLMGLINQIDFKNPLNYKTKGEQVSFICTCDKNVYLFGSTEVISLEMRFKDDKGDSKVIRLIGNNARIGFEKLNVPGSHSILTVYKINQLRAYSRFIKCKDCKRMYLVCYSLKIPEERTSEIGKIYINGVYKTLSNNI